MKQQWIDLLRAGDYKQPAWNTPGTHCVLGVLTQMISDEPLYKPRWIQGELFDADPYYDSDHEWDDWDE